MLATSAAALLTAGVFAYTPAHAQVGRTYYVHQSAYLYNASKRGHAIATLPVNAKLTTTSGRTSKRYRVTYKGRKGYVSRANLLTRRTNVTRYVYNTAALYTASSASKQQIQTLAVDKSVVTDSDLSQTMYHVTVNGRTGYVYRSRLSSRKRTISLTLKNRAYLYKNYAHTAHYSGLIPTNTRLTTTSPQSNQLFWVKYKKHSGYVYASNFVGMGSYQTQFYNQAIPSGATGYVANGGNHGIWNKPYGLEGATDVDSLFHYNNLPLSLLQESKVGNTVWVQIACNNRTLGWIHKDTIQYADPHLSFAYVANDSGSIYNAPNGSASASLTPYAQLKLKIDSISSDGQWVHIRKFTAGTSLGWAKMSDLTVTPPLEDKGDGPTINVSYGVTVTDNQGPVFDDSINFQGYLNQYLNGGSLAVTQERLIGNEELYHLTQNGQSIGWVRSNAIHVNKGGALSDSSYVFSLIPDDIYNGLSDGSAADSNATIDYLIGYDGRMLEIVKQSGDYSFIKYNDWYDQDGYDIDLGWVKTSDLQQLPNGTGRFGYLFGTEGGNQQGLAYDSDDNIYFVGYDTGSGYGKIVPYVSDGNGSYRADDSRAITGAFGHACALSYANHMLYEVSSAGVDPVLYTINPRSMQIETTTTLTGMPYVSMMTVKDSDTLIMLTEAGSSDAFSEYSIKENHFTDPNAHKVNDLGVVQGMQYDADNHKLYYLANNYVAVLNDNYELIPDQIFHFSIPSGGPAQESEGLTIANNKLTIGFGNHQIYQENNR